LKSPGIGKNHHWNHRPTSAFRKSPESQDYYTQGGYFNLKMIINKAGILSLFLCFAACLLWPAYVIAKDFSRLHCGSSRSYTLDYLLPSLKNDLPSTNYGPLPSGRQIHDRRARDAVRTEHGPAPARRWSLKLMIRFSPIYADKNHALLEKPPACWSRERGIYWSHLTEALLLAGAQVRPSATTIRQNHWDISSISRRRHRVIWEVVAGDVRDAALMRT